MGVRVALIEFCRASVEERIKTSTEAIEEARASSASETKSSAGDKYETTREMLQGVIEQHTRQLQEAKQLRDNLRVILENPVKKGFVGAGSVVHTTGGNFFLAIPAGFTDIAGERYALISIQSPIGRLLLERKKGDSVSFNAKNYTITSIL